MQGFLYPKRYYMDVEQSKTENLAPNFEFAPLEGERANLRGGVQANDDSRE